MNKKVISVLAALVMLSAPMVLIVSDDSNAEASEPVTIHPFSGESIPWVSKEAILYTGNFTLYFTDNPYDEVVKYLNGEITLDTLKTRCGYMSSPPSSGSYYQVSNNYGGSGNGRIDCCHYDVRAIDIIDNNFSLYFTENPKSEVINYLKKNITMDELKTRCGYTESPDYGMDYHVSYYGGDSVTIQHGYDYMNYDYVNLRDHCYYYVSYMHFTSDPYDEVVRFINKEITLDELKTKCGYTENGNTNDYHVYFSNGALRVQHEEHDYIRNGPNMYADVYFTDDPYENVVKYLNDKMTLDELIAECGYTEFNDRVLGTRYYSVSITGYSINSTYDSVDEGMIRAIPIEPHYLFLGQGKYHIDITDTNMTHVYLRNLTNDRNSKTIEIKNGTGSTDYTAKIPEAVYFSGGKDGSTGSALENTWREMNITYTMDPSPDAGKKMDDFSRNVMIMPDREWVRMTTVQSLTGTYMVYGSNTFISGSEEESEFLRDVVNKGLIKDSSSYSGKKLVANNDKIVRYYCRQTSSGTPEDIYLRWSSEGNETYDKADYFDSKMEKMPIGDVKPFKIYANYDFSIAVKYDTSKIRAVVLMYPVELSQTQYMALESGRVYDLHMISSAEYELFAIPISSSGATLEPVEVGIYTDNVATPDGNGFVFAVVAIALCAAAFFVLFRSGRRPKWSDNTGLPTTDAKTVKNETPKDGPPKE